MSVYRQDTTMERHLREMRVDQGKDALAQTGLDLSTNIGEPSPVESKGKGKTSKSRLSLVRHREEAFETNLSGLHIASPEAVESASWSTRAQIIEQFKVACSKENVIKRKRAIHKRIEWVITSGGAASLTQAPNNEALGIPVDSARSKWSRHAPQVLESGSPAARDDHTRSKRLRRPHQVPVEEQDNHARPRRLRRGHGNPSQSNTDYMPSASPDAPVFPDPYQLSNFSAPYPPFTPPGEKMLPPLPSRESSGPSFPNAPTATQAPINEWIDEDDALFEHQMQAARELSLQTSMRSSNTSTSHSPGGDNHAELESPKTYEEALLVAAAQWSEEPVDLNPASRHSSYQAERGSQSIAKK